MDLVTLAAAKKYVKDTMTGAGAVQGKPGKSAYELAVEGGYQGTVAQWLQSLVGQNGKDGKASFERELLWEGNCSMGGAMSLNNSIYDYQFIIVVIGKCDCLGFVFPDKEEFMAFGGRVNNNSIGSCAARLAIGGSGTSLTNVEAYYMTHFSNGSNSQAFTSSINAIYGYKQTPVNGDINLDSSFITDAEMEEILNG